MRKMKLRREDAQWLIFAGSCPTRASARNVGVGKMMTTIEFPAMVIATL